MDSSFTNSGYAVVLTITSGTGTSGATLSIGGPVTATNGRVSFRGLSIDTAGTGYTLTATPIQSGGFTFNRPGTFLSTAFNIN